MTESLREIWQFRPLVLELVRRDLKLRYKNSVGGIMWSLFTPLMQIVVITLSLKFIRGNPIKDYSAHLFILFLWSFFQISLADGCGAILNNATLVRKIYFPRAILPLVTLIANFFHFGVAFVFTLLYFFARSIYPQNLRLEFLMVLPTIFFSFALCLGLTYIASYLNVFYEDVRIIVTSLLGLFFWLLPIVHTVEEVQAKGLLDIYLLNPMAAFLVTYQRALLPPPQVVVDDGVLPAVGIPWGHFALACAVSTIILVVGFALFERYKWEVVERV